MRSTIKAVAPNTLSLGGLILLATIVRFFGLSRRPFDGDEGVIIQIAGSSLSHLWQTFTTDVHPPLFHLLTWLSIHLFGLSEFSVRLISVLSGIGIVFVLYKLTNHFFGRKAAFLIGLLAALSPYLLFYSQESRMYSLFTLTTLAATWQWLLYLEKKDQKNGLYWVIWLTASLWTQHLAILIALIQGVTVLVQLKQYKKFLFLTGLGMVLYLPIIFQTFHQFSGRLHEQQNGSLIGNLIGLLNAFYRFIPGRIFLSLEPSPAYYIHWLQTDPLLALFFFVTLIVPLTLIVRGAILLYAKKRFLFWPLASLFIAFIVVALFSNEIGSRSTRYLSFLSPYIFMLTGLGIFSFKSKLARIILSIIVILILMSGLYSYYSREQKAIGSRDIALFLSQNATKGDTVLARGAFLGGETTVLQYYLDQIKGPNLILIDYFGSYHPGNLLQLKDRPIQDVLAKDAPDAPRVWYYDFTYSNQGKDGIMHEIGKDKENQELNIYEIKR
jgi:uncharacterized membrane protein